jgi:hypothetical protein
MSRMVSPNDLQKVAQDIMLDGREPESENDWVLCVNFWAYNAALLYEVIEDAVIIYCLWKSGGWLMRRLGK